MKKKFFLFSVLFLFAFSVFAGNLLIKIPFRVINYKGNQELQKSDIIFKVNGKIENKFFLLKRERAIVGNGLPLKYYVLDFNLFDYYKDIGNAIDYFIDNVLNNEPVILLTRNKIYKFFNYNSKSYLKDTIKKLLREDTIKFKAETKSYFKKFKNILSRADLSTKEGCQKFINDYLREWSVYKTRFVYPDLRKYQMLSNVLSDKDGDKFIVSFYHREIIPYYDKVQKALSDMNNFVSSATEGEDQAWATMISGGINDINQSLLISKSFPSKNLLNIFLKNNISFDLILLNNKMNQKGGDAYSDIAPDMEKILKDVAKKSGGISVTSDDLKKSIKDISGHKDTYYCILYKAKKAKDFKFNISFANKDIKAVYPEVFKKDFLKKLEKIRKDKVNISNVSVSSKRIAFSISNFKMKKRGGKKLGALKVDIFVKDGRGNIAYKTGNILNVVKRTINIKLPPVNLQGDYNLYIVARDLLGESSTIFEKKVSF